MKNLSTAFIIPLNSPHSPAFIKIKKAGETSASSALSLGGGYLLSHLRSTIGVAGLNCSVRNG